MVHLLQRPASLVGLVKPRLSVAVLASFAVALLPSVASAEVSDKIPSDANLFLWCAAIGTTAVLGFFVARRSLLGGTLFAAVGVLPFAIFFGELLLSDIAPAVLAEKGPVYLILAGFCGTAIPVAVLVSTLRSHWGSN